MLLAQINDLQEQHNQALLFNQAFKVQKESPELNLEN